MKREDYLKLYGITEEQIGTLRPMSSLKYSEVNEICSIILGKEITCGKIDWVDDKSFVYAIFKKEEDITGEYDFVEMGISINDEFEIDYFWNYCTKNSSGHSSQKLSNHNELTAYLIKEKFDLFGLSKKN